MYGDGASSFTSDFADGAPQNAPIGRWFEWIYFYKFANTITYNITQRLVNDSSTYCWGNDERAHEQIAKRDKTNAADDDTIRSIQKHRLCRAPPKDYI